MAAPKQRLAEMENQSQFEDQPPTPQTRPPGPAPLTVPEDRHPGSEPEMSGKQPAATANGHL